MLVGAALLVGCGGGSNPTGNDGAAAKDGSAKATIERILSRPGTGGGGVVLTPQQAKKALREMRERKGQGEDAQILGMLEKLHTVH
jgi:hypothetical protein